MILRSLSSSSGEAPSFPRHSRSAAIKGHLFGWRSPHPTFIASNLHLLKLLAFGGPWEGWCHGGRPAGSGPQPPPYPLSPLPFPTAPSTANSRSSMAFLRQSLSIFLLVRSVT